MHPFTRGDSPAFARFKARAAALLAEHPGLVRLDCLNPVRAIRPAAPAARPPGLTLDAAWRHALAVRFTRCAHSTGVRQALHDVLAAGRGPVALPVDVYPVYHRIAAAAGRPVVYYPTLPRFEVGAALVADTVVVTAPLTPLGRDLTPDEVTVLCDWVRAAPGRLVVVDRVYDYANSPVVQPLVDTDRAVLLYSLSKTHLAPLLAGLAVVPGEMGLPATPSPDADRAATLLAAHADLPAYQRSVFRHRWGRLAATLRAADPGWEPPETGYLSVVRGDADALLRRGLLVVPGDVYDAPAGLAVVSCLHESLGAGEDEAVERVHVTVLSNFARGYDKYTRRYDKARIPESTFPDRFFLLPPDHFGHGCRKAAHLLKPGDALVALHTRVRAHELRANRRTGVGEYVERPWVEVEAVSVVEGDRLRPAAVEEVYAGSLLARGDLRPWAAVRPRALSVLPIAQACQARCPFCFSHASLSEDQRQGRVVLDRLEAACAAAAAAGAGRFVVTGGGEPTLLAPARLLDLLRTGARHFPTVVLITNGLALGRMGEADRLATLRAYRAAGLTVLAVSRHSPDANDRIMGVATHSERVAATWAANRADLAGLRLRWVCVLQRAGVCDADTLAAYLDWAAGTGVEEVCFKELYVSVTAESVYADAGYNRWCRDNQVPLALVTGFLARHGAVREGELPWGAPVFAVRWAGRVLRVAAYTEPSVFWERTHGVCRSWNLMADGTCYASLEAADSAVPLGG